MKKLFLGLFPFLIVFLAALNVPHDIDLGWHLKYGEYFFAHGNLLRDNTFSTMMPDYHWVNSSWLTDLFTYGAYHLLGFLGLTLLAAVVITLTFLFVSLAFRLTFFEQAFLFPILLYIEDPLNSVSFRGQLLSMFLISVLLFVLNRLNKVNPKWTLVLIPVFLIWSNIHGEYLLGLGLFFCWLVFKVVELIFFTDLEEKELATKSLIIAAVTFVFSGLATLINPFGISIYQESLHHFANPWQKYIAEWLPFISLSQLWWNHIIYATLLLFSLIAIFFTNQYKKILPIIGVSVIVFLMTFFIRRYAWPFYYLSIPLLLPIVHFLQPDTKKFQTIGATILLALVLVVVILFKLPFQQFASMNWDRYCFEFSYCSPKSAEILSNYPQKNNLLTAYDFGGWLIWNYPNIKPSIDGRMHLWQDDKGYSAFAEYYPLEQNWQDINNSDYNLVYMSTSKPMYQRLEQLVSEGKWKSIYQDQFAGIFERI